MLVVGGLGRDGSRLTSTVEYNPATDTWTTRASMTAPRSGHTATLLLDGRVLVTGGYTTASSAQELSSVEIYDRSLNRWVLAAPMHTPRGGHAASLLSDGRVLVVGRSFAVGGSAAEVYDPTKDAWSITAPMATPRIGASTTRLADGRVLVVGGAGGPTPGYLTAAEIYDPSKDVWPPGGTMTYGRTAHTATLLLDGRVLVVGGAGGERTAELFDPRTVTWSLIAGGIPVGRLLATATLMPSGRVAVIGGLGDTGKPGPPGPTATSAIYDPAADVWSSGPLLRTARMVHTATLLPDGGILVVGGATGSESAQATGDTEYVRLN